MGDTDMTTNAMSKIITIDFSTIPLGLQCQTNL